MQFIPAIDIKDCLCVRASGIDLNPLAQASDFIEHGAEYIHVVDINAALSGGSTNFNHIRHIVALPDVKVEVSAGITTPADILRYFQLHPKPWQIILSSRAMFDFSFIKTAFNRFGANHFTLSLDYNQDKVAARGWKETSSLTVEKALQEVNTLGAHRIIVTDIEKDGTLAGIDLPRIQTFRSLVKKELVISGGVQSLGDVLSLQKLGVDGVIVGRALYEKKIDVNEAITATKRV